MQDPLRRALCDARGSYRRANVCAELSAQHRDDFGTGYSSLSYLRSFPFDKIKIDQSFVRDLGSNRDAQAIVRSIISLGMGLGVTITAEGVETEAEFSCLRDEGCHEGQGYLFSHARPNAEIVNLLRAQSGVGPDEEAALVA